MSFHINLPSLALISFHHYLTSPSFLFTPLPTLKKWLQIFNLPKKLIPLSTCFPAILFPHYCIRYFFIALVVVPTWLKRATIRPLFLKKKPYLDSQNESSYCQISLLHFFYQNLERLVDVRISSYIIFFSILMNSSKPAFKTIITLSPFC